MIIDLKPKDEKSNDTRSAIAKKLKEKIKSPCQKILLINPQMVSEQEFSIEVAKRGRYSIYQPYGCGVLYANLYNRGYQVHILDFNFETLKAAREKDFRYSFWKELLVKSLSEFQPDLVGISCLFSMSHEMIKDISREIKKYDLSIPVISGGVHFTESKQLALSDCPDIDFIGIFEHDQSFPNLVDFANNKLTADKLAQVATIIDDQYITLGDRTSPTPQEISVIPMYGDLPIGEYSNFGQVGTYGFLSKHRRASSASTNRGCRAHCSFCAVPELSGRGIVRFREIPNVIEEIKILYYEYGIKHISWLDDDLLHTPKRIITLFQSIADLKLDITWDASNGLIASAITENIMDAMVTSGCIGFNLGIETGNPDRLTEIHKPSSIKSFRNAKRISDKYPNLFIKGFLIIGFPDETLGQLLDTVNLGLELQLDWYSLQILNPLPSTEIHGDMVKRGLIENVLNTNKSAYVFGTNGRQRIIEEREKLAASDFFDLFGMGRPEDLIQPEQLKDLLFLVDYKINYEIILAITHPAKLKNKDLALEDICERIAPESPLAQLFYGITRQQFGDFAQARVQAQKTCDRLAESAYWRKRFDVLDLYPLIDSIS